jgi:hypothetical protein
MWHQTNCRRGRRWLFIPSEKEKGSGENPKPFGLCAFARILQVNGRLSALFSFALSNCKHFFGGLGQSPKDEGDGQNEK